MIQLKEFLEGKNIRQLKTLFTYWNEERLLPKERSDLIEKLTAHMTDEQLLTEQLGVLSPRLKNLLSLFLEVKGFAMGWKQLHNLAESLARHNQLEAAIHALAQRGFLFVEADRAAPNHGNARYMVPQEVGNASLSILKREKRSTAAIFSLEDFLQAESILAEPPSSEKKGNQLPGCPEVVPTSTSFRQQVKKLKDPDLRKVLPAVLQQFGGIAPRTRVLRMGNGGWKGKEWGRQLEDARLGTVAFLSLEEYGINLMDETIVLFREWVDGVFSGSLRKKPDRELCSRIDFIIDLESLVYFVRRNPLKVTRTGEVSKITKKTFIPMVLNRDLPNLTADSYFDLLLQVARELGLFEGKEEALKVSPKGLKAWRALSINKKINDLFPILSSRKLSARESFHHPKIKKICLSMLGNLKVGKWYDILSLPFLSRNTYLSQLDEQNIKQLYQSNRHYSSLPPKYDSDEMARNLFTFLVERVYPLGIIDLGLKGKKVTAMRLSPLGAKVFGRKVRGKGSTGSIIVSPDFEVVLIPEETDYSLLYSIPQFSRRIKSERVYQFKISAETVREGVSRGLSCKQILNTLKKNSRNEIPQNLEFSIREWASQVRFVKFERVLLLRGGDSQAIDRILASGILNEMLLERLSSTVLALKGGISDKSRKEIESLGIYIHGET